MGYRMTKTQRHPKPTRSSACRGAGTGTQARSPFTVASSWLCCLLIAAVCLAATGSARAADHIPILPTGVVTTLSLAAGETAQFALPVTAGTTYTLDLDAAGHAVVVVSGPDDETVGRFLAAYGLTFTAGEESIYTLSVSGNGEDPLAARLAAHTGALPLYRPATAEEHPDFMASPWYVGAEYGYVYVPADRTPANRHAYRLAILQMQGGPDATYGPLVFLTGGPGVSAFSGAFLKAPLTDTVPVIAVSQRGAHLSQPNLFPVSPEETTVELQQRLGGPEGIDFNTINTRQNAADILDVMTALGHHEPFNLWGTSYGTMLAQEVIRQAPERVRAAVLDGVVTLDLPQWTSIGQTFLDGLEALFDDVAQHPEASLLYPDFREAFFEFAASLYPDGHSEFFEGPVFGAINLSRWARVENLPGIIWRAMRGETAAIAELAAVYPPDPPPPDGGPLSENMYCAVLQQDFLPFESMETADALVDAIPFPLNMVGHDFSLFQYEFCAEWDFLAPAPASFRTPLTNDVPVLVINGTYDTMTGLAGARHVADHLPNAHYVELPAIGHAVLQGGDVPLQIARGFLTNPHAAPDTSALSSLALDFPPPWPADAPMLRAGTTVSGTLHPSETALYPLSIEDPVWHGVYVDATGLDLQVYADDLSVPGIYHLALSNSTESPQPYTLRLGQ